MRSLFLKVFLWFWLSTVLVIGALLITSHLTGNEPTFRPPQFIEAVLSGYGRNAAAAYEHGGASALKDYLLTIDHETGIHAHLCDARGMDLSGAEASAQQSKVAQQVAQTGQPIFRDAGGRMLEVRPVPARDGRSYAFVAEMPVGHPPPGGPHGPFWLFSESGSVLLIRLLVVILTAGALCYLLARYIVTPVVKLREVTRQVTRGDLSARVGPRLGKRRDELAAMGHDFDAMATRVETLLSAQTRLLRDISHELRSPLARLSVALDLARKRAGVAATADLDRIEREAKRLNEMIGQLLTLSRRESDGNGVRTGPVRLDALLREVASDADFEAQGRNCSVVVTECDECEVTGTAPLLRSAIENVVRNAVRYTEEGTTVKLSLRCGRGDDAGHAVICVRDEGAGVPEETLADIFRPFYRMDDSRARETGGTGLGLAITERAMQLHGGTVKASNVLGGGFVVELRLPLHSTGRDSV
ncbi:MAG: two-component system, OmpR family, sensor histidine kinase CpxA [Acidobacteriota bacterium]|nr:two-component system, OmpR family, sensor histidine kinase CpxA [Acidobacteriota bacterium]